jgi:glycosyltransferase involved in cell wall biosynthesis
LVEEESVIQRNHLERDLRSVLWNGWLQNEGAAIIERERPDVLYERYCMFGWGGVELSRRYRIPLILEVNGPDCMEQAGYEKFTLTRTAERMESEILRHADILIVLSQWLKNWALSLGVEATRVRVLPNAVSEQVFGGELSGDAIRARHGLGGKSVIGFVGSFQKWHDLKGLLRVFAGLYDKDPNLRLLLVGDGNQRKALQKSVRELGLSDVVIFPGRIPHEQVPAYIAGMDVTVVPYGSLMDFYFSPLKLFEYMAVGRPTVAAALGQIAEVVEHGKTGWLYPAGDNGRLAEGIATLLYDQQLARRIGEAARKIVLNRYTWGRVTAEVTALAQRLLGER